MNLSEATCWFDQICEWINQQMQVDLSEAECEFVKRFI